MQQYIRRTAKIQFGYTWNRDNMGNDPRSTPGHPKALQMPLLSSRSGLESVRTLRALLSRYIVQQFNRNILLHAQTDRKVCQRSSTTTRTTYLPVIRTKSVSHCPVGPSRTQNRAGRPCNNIILFHRLYCCTVFRHDLTSC